MFKKRILSLFVAMTLVLTAVMPSVTFATDNEEANEAIEEVVENQEGEQEGISLENFGSGANKENIVTCVKCESENVTLISDVLHLYHCDDCGKYFTKEVEINTKSIDEQVEDAKESEKEKLESTLFGGGTGVPTAYHLLFNGVDYATVESSDFNGLPTDEQMRELFADYINGDLEEKLSNLTLAGWASKEIIARNNTIEIAPGGRLPRVDTHKYWTIFDVKEYTITVYKNIDDTVLDTKKVKYPNSYSYNTEPSEDGYKFLGFSDDKDAVDGEAEINIDEVTENKDYYAIWIKQLGVKYADGDYTEYDEGETVTLRSDYAEKVGYDLIGWSETEDATEVEYDLNGTIEGIDRAYVLYPVYAPIDCTIIIDGDERIEKYDKVITLPESCNEEKEGHDFVGWSTKENDDTAEYDKGGEYKVEGDKELFPVYSAKEFDVKIGDEEFTKKYGETVNLPETCESDDDTKTFDYFEDEDGNHYGLGDDVLVDGEKTIIPVFKDKEKFAVKFFDGDVEYEGLLENIFDGHKATKPSDPEKENYNFVEWQLNGTKYDFDKAITEEIELTAVWEGKPYNVKIGEEEFTKKYGETVKLPETCEVPDDTKLFDYFEDEDGNHYGLGDDVLVDGEKTIIPVFKDKEKFKVRYFDGTIEFIDLCEEIYDGFTATNKTVDDKEHYLFKGWKTSDGLEYNFEIAVTSELKLYAIWEAKKYTVNVDGDEKEVAYGDKIILPTTKESTDNTKVFDDFVDEDGNHYEGGKEVTVDGPKTFTPTFKEKNKIFVRYFDGTTELTDLKEEVYEGFEAADKTLEDKEHYLFKGWKTSSGSIYNFGTAVTSEVKLYAIWEAKKYTVNVDGEESEKSYGDKFNLPTTCESSDNTKTFDYYKDEKGNHYALGGEVTVDGNKTITPVFKDKNKYTVKFYDDLTEYTELRENIFEGDSATEPTTSPTKDNYDFVEWRLNSKKYDFTTPITKNITLVAAWKGKMYDVTVDGKTTQKEYGTKFNLPNTYTSTDNTKAFNYYEDEDGTHYTLGGEVLVDGKKTITVVLKDNAFTVQFYNGTSEYTSAKKTNVIYGNKITAPSVSVAAGKEIEGWYKESTFKNLFNFSTDTITANTKLYVKLKNINYTVQFYNGTTEYTAAKLTTVTYGNKITAPSVSVAAGKEIEGWYKESTFKNLFNFSTDTITANTKLYVKLKNINYTVQFYDGTTEYTTAKLTTVTYGSMITAPSVSVAAGKEIEGWYKDSAFKNLFNFSKDTITANTKLYVKLKNINYTVQFYNGTTEYTSAKLTTVTYGSKISAPSVSIATGKVLEGWHVGSTSGTKFDFGKDTITADTKLYVKFEDAKYTVNINFNGYKLVTGKKSQHYDMWLGGYHLVGDEELPECSSDTGQVITSSATYKSTVTLPTLNLHVISNDRYYTDRDVFLGYDTDKNAKWPKYKAGDKVTITGNTTFYPIFPPKVCWTLNNNGGQGRKDDPSLSTSSMWLPYGSQLTLRGAYKPGRTFYGWSTDPDASSPTYKEGETVTLSGEAICKNDGKLVLYAVYSGPRGYVTDFRISNADAKYDIKTLQNDGYWLLKDFTDGTADINRLDKDDCGNKMYIGYKCSLSSANAITDIYATKTWAGEKTVHDGMTYYLVYCGTSYSYCDQKDRADCNDGAGGDDIYLYYTRDKRAGSPIRAGYMDLYDRNSGSPSYYSQYNSSIGKINPAIVCWNYGGTSMADLNSGCGSKSKNVYIICR